MKRRNFLQAAVPLPFLPYLHHWNASVGAPEPLPTVRFVMFNAPRSEICAIYWTNSHMPVERFVWMHEQADIAIPPDQVKHGWATYKLSGAGMYLSDVALPNFEPLTYWIPADG
jgi:hypothetical protein